MRRHPVARRRTVAAAVHASVLGVLLVVGLGLGLVVAGAEPAYADNCSGLSDCSPSVYGAISLLGGLLGLGVAAAVFSSIPPGRGGGSGDGSGSGSGSGAGAGSGGGSPGGPPPGNPPGPPGTSPPPIYPIELPPTYDGDPAQQQAMNEARQRLENKLAQGLGPKDWVKDINPTGSTNNCVDAAKAVDQSLGGNPTVAHPAYRGQNGDELQAAYPGRSNNDATLDSIANDVRQSGPGSKGIVTVYSGNDAHAFNVTNDNGKVTWIDGQTGRVASTPGGILGPAKYDPTQSTFKFLKTYP